MPSWIKDLAEAALSRWHTYTGLGIALIVVALASLFLFSALDFRNVSLSEWVGLILVFLAVTGVWWRTHIPRTPKGKLGFAVAMVYDRPDQARALRADLVMTMRDLVNDADPTRRFHFVEVPEGIANRLVDADSAVEFAKRCRLGFLIYGRARVRRLNGVESHIIDLRGVVRHAALQAVESERLGQDFGRSWPRRMLLSTDGSFLACEFAAKHLDAVSRYVIGSASTVSDDFLFAEQLLRDSENRLKDVMALAQASELNVLLQRVQERLRELYARWLSQLTAEYTRRRDTQSLESAETIIAKLRQYDPESYLARTMAAVCAFVLRRDLPAARSELQLCRKVQDSAWMYGEAFLFAYEGDLDRAYRSYRDAFSSPKKILRCQFSPRSLSTLC